MQKNAWIIGGALVVLMAAIGVLAWLNASPVDVQGGVLQIVQGEEMLATFTLADIRAMPSISVQKEIVSASYDDDSGLFTGVPMRTVLEAAQSGILENADQIVARAEDSFVTAYKAAEVQKSDDILIVYEKDGEIMKSRAEGGLGPLRVIIQNDTFGTRSTKYLVQLEVR